ncbi:hypothetical protein GQ457_11G021230 [Hibiscus cannabinus]
MHSHSGITKYGTIGAHSIVKKEDVIEYRGVKKVKPKYQMKVDRFFFHSRGSAYFIRIFSIMVRNNSIIGVDTQITLNTRSQEGGLISRHSGILIPPGTDKTNSKELKK